jgi:peptide/nickel transport system substrate-binding protein
MHRAIATRRWLILCMLLATIATACAPSAPTSTSRAPAAPGSGQERPAGQRKVLNMGLATVIDAFSIAGSSTTSGGGLSYVEIHSQALFTADKTTGRPIPRMLSELPTLDNGGLRITDDGKMIATYKLRPDVKWADKTPVTTRDLLFTYKVTKDPSMPVIDTGPAKLMESATAPDDRTFVVTYSQPYYLADAIGLRAFWPLPAHLLEADYTNIVEGQKDGPAFLSRPYWTSEYVHVGPFKLVEFTPQVQAVFEAVDDYFLGRPKVDRIVVKQFTDPNTVYANILSNALDLASDNVLKVENATLLKQQWDADGGGRVYFGTGTTQFVSMQFDSSVPNFNPGTQDVRVRQGLYHAIDRDAYAEAISGGIPDKAANAMLPPDNPLYSYVKDAWKQRYPYDQNRATAALEQAGWRRGTDGMLANAAGQPLHVEIRATADNEKRAPIVADMWKRVGVDPSVAIVSAARARDAEYRQQFPGGEVTARGSQDAILTRLECSEQPTPQNRFGGNNRGHWCNPDYERLVGMYRTALREEPRGEAMRQIQDLVLQDLPILLLNYEISVIFARRTTTAFEDDFLGGSEAGRIYGTYSRNAHEWDMR